VAQACLALRFRSALGGFADAELTADLVNKIAGGGILGTSGPKILQSGDQLRVGADFGGQKSEFVLLLLALFADVPVLLRNEARLSQ
jgi:hypothetical protein